MPLVVALMSIYARIKLLDKVKALPGAINIIAFYRSPCHDIVGGEAAATDLLIPFLFLVLLCLFKHSITLCAHLHSSFYRRRRLSDNNRNTNSHSP